MATFTKKHYAKLAEVIRGLTSVQVSTGPGRMRFEAVNLPVMLDALCEMFQEDNPKFNRRSFLRAVESIYFDTVEMGVLCVVEHNDRTGEERIVPVGEDNN